MYTVFATIDIPVVGGGALGVFPIAMSVMVAHLFLLPIDGCSINPTRSFGPSLIAAMAGIDGRYYHQQYMWVVKVFIYYIHTKNYVATDRNYTAKLIFCGFIVMSDLENWAAEINIVWISMFFFVSALVFILKFIYLSYVLSLFFHLIMGAPKSSEAHKNPIHSHTESSTLLF